MGKRNSSIGESGVVHGSCGIIVWGKGDCSMGNVK